MGQDTIEYLSTGGIGVISDGTYSLDLNLMDYDVDDDEIIALAGQFSFQPPEDIRGHRIFVEGKSLRYLDVTTSALTNSGSKETLS